MLIKGELGLLVFLSTSFAASYISLFWPPSHFFGYNLNCPFFSLFDMRESG